MLQNKKQPKYVINNQILSFFWSRFDNPINSTVFRSGQIVVDFFLEIVINSFTLQVFRLFVALPYF